MKDANQISQSLYVRIFSGLFCLLTRCKRRFFFVPHRRFEADRGFWMTRGMLPTLSSHHPLLLTGMHRPTSQNDGPSHGPANLESPASTKILDSPAPQLLLAGHSSTGLEFSWLDGWGDFGVFFRLQQRQGWNGTFKIHVLMAIYG